MVIDIAAVETVCPHCKKITSTNLDEEVKLNTEHNVLCHHCFKGFSIVIANGIDNAFNVVVTTEGTD